MAQQGAAASTHTGAATELGHLSPWFEIGGYLSSEQSRGEGVLFVPFTQGSRDLVFMDLRGKLFRENIKEGNLALGYRHMLGNGWNLGVWGGLDLRRSSHGSLFRQAAGGFEALHGDFDFRLNGYLPLNDEALVSSSTTTTLGASTVVVTGNQIAIRSSTSTTTQETREYALWGVDAEIGFRMPLELVGLDAGKNELRLYAGAHYFDHADTAPLKGPKARMEWRVNDVIDDLPGSRLTLEAEYKYDNQRSHQYEGGLRLRIPFGAHDADERLARLASLTPQRRRMTEGLERDTDVVGLTRATGNTTEETSEEGVRDAITGVVFDRVVAVDGSDDEIAGVAVVDAGPNSLVIVNGAHGIVGSLPVLANQTLLGGGAPLRLEGITSNQELVFVAPGQRPIIQGANPQGESVTVLGVNAHISGVEIRGPEMDPQVASENIGIFLTPNVDELAFSGNVEINNINGYAIRTTADRTRIRMFESPIPVTSLSAPEGEGYINFLFDDGARGTFRVEGTADESELRIGRASTSQAQLANHCDFDFITQVESCPSSTGDITIVDVDLISIVGEATLPVKIDFNSTRGILVEGGWIGFTADASAIRSINTRSGFNPTLTVDPWVFGRLLTRSSSPDEIRFQAGPQSNIVLGLNSSPARIGFAFDTEFPVDTPYHIIVEAPENTGNQGGITIGTTGSTGGASPPIVATSSSNSGLGGDIVIRNSSTTGSPGVIAAK